MDCIGASVITWSLGATFDFNAKVGRPIGIRCLQDFNGVHGFGLHPLHAPCTGMNCLVRTRNVANAPILATVMTMWSLAPSVPAEKETRPTVVMHRHRCTGRNRNFEHTYNRENHLQRDTSTSSGLLKRHFGGALASSSRAAVRNRLLSFQRRPNPRPLLSAQRRELKTVLCSQCTNNFRRDHLFVGVRRGDFEHYRLAQCQSLSHEGPQTAFAEIAHPAL